MWNEVKHDIGMEEVLWMWLECNSQRNKKFPIKVYIHFERMYERYFCYS
jgi:hypothetical protein